MPLKDYEPDLCPKFNPDNSFNECGRYIPAKNPLECGFCKLDENYRCIADVHRVIPLSHSSVQRFLTCHHLYYLTSIRGIEIRPQFLSDALKAGSLWDIVLQSHLNPAAMDRETHKPVSIKDTINRYQIPERVVSKVNSLYRAYKLLDIAVQPGYALQHKIDLRIPLDKKWGNGYPCEVLVTGYYDRYYPELLTFAENKLTTRPEDYLDPYFIQSQIGTYFLADPNLLYCIMEVARTPDLKSTGKNKDESNEEYRERVYQDIISRPSHYFRGWDGRSKYGKRYFRDEFDLADIKSRFTHIFREIHDARLMNGFYKNDKVCSNVLPGIPCDMLPICRTGKMSEDVYKIRDKEIF